MKQLQAECKKRKIGFMTSWTKMALIKRLEDEDKKDSEILKIKESAEKKLKKANAEKIKSQKKVASVNKKLKDMDEGEIQRKAIEQLRKDKSHNLRNLKQQLDGLTTIQEDHYKKASEIGDEKSKLMDEIQTLEIMIKSLIQGLKPIVMNRKGSGKFV